MIYIQQDHLDLEILLCQMEAVNEFVRLPGAALLCLNVVRLPVALRYLLNPKMMP